MRAVILAAGRGSRMNALTERHPKCLVSVAGKTLLEWQLAALEAGGIVETALVTGYFAEQLQDAGPTVFHNPDWAETNMVRTLLCADEWLEGDSCVISYSDIVYHPDHVKALIQENADLCLTYDLIWQKLWRERFDDPLVDAETFRIDGQGWLIEIGNRAKSIEDIEGQYMGLLKFSPSGWQKIKSVLGPLPGTVVDKLDMTGLISRALAEGVKVKAIPVRGQWCEVDNEKDIGLYKSKLQSGLPWYHKWLWNEKEQR